MTVTERTYTTEKPPPVRPLLGFRIKPTGWSIELWKKNSFAEVESKSFWACFRVIWTFWRKK